MGTVTKALTLLTLFNQSRPMIGLSDITRLSGLNKATAFRLLGELQAMGMVEQVGNNRAYRLGPELLHLAALREAAVPLLSVARQTLAHLSRTTGETAHMSHIRGQRLHMLAYAYGARHGTQVRMEDAAVLPFHATGSGLAVLGFCNADFVDDILSRPLASHTGATQTDPKLIRAALDNVRRTGLAESISGFETDVHSLATPVFGPAKAPIGALAVATPVSRMTEPQNALIRSELRRAAQNLTHQTGGLFPPHFPIPDAA